MSEPIEGEIVLHGKELAKFNPADMAIAGYRERYMPIRVADPTDKANAALAKAGRLEVKKTRCAVENIRKDLKADALKFGQAVDAEARRITAELEAIESHLQEQEDIVAKYAARIAAEAAAKAEADRIEAARIAEEERRAMIARIEALEREKREAAERAEAEALARFAGAKRKADEEAARIAQEVDAKAREERAALEAKAAAERAAAEREEALKEQARREVARIKAEAEAREKAIRDEAEARERERQAEEKRKADEAARIAREAEEERARKEAEAIAKAKAEAARPDKDKLAAFASQIQNMSPPELSTVEMQAVSAWTTTQLARLADAIRAKL